MKKNNSPLAARAALGTLMFIAGIALLCSIPFLGSRGQSPATGTVDPVGIQTASWNGTANSPGGNNNTEATCVDSGPAQSCEVFTLTVSGNQAAWAGKKVQVLLTWMNAANEYDIFIHKGTLGGPLITFAYQGPAITRQVAFIDAGSIDPSNPTTVFVLHLVHNVTPAAAADHYHGTATAVSTATAAVLAAPQDTGAKVGYENFEAPGVLVPGTALSSGGVTVEYMGRGAGEPSVGANWVTGVVNFQSDLQTLFITFDDTCNLSNPKATWVNRRAPTSNFVDSDPIGFTDHTSATANRVFASELTLLSPDTVKMSHTDNDGVTWVPDQTGGIASAIDHQTIGGGPYALPLPSPIPSPSPAPNPGVVYPHAVYYCSQDIAFASCSRSDDGGSTYGPSITIYPISSCTGLHGHLKVSPADGTVYVPDRACGNVPILNGGNAAVVVSGDNGITWSIRPVQNGSDPNTGATDDPALAIDSAGKIYCLFAQGGTTAAVGISSDKGLTWKNIYDVGAGLGLTNVAFPAAAGGDSGRAAVAFYASKGGTGNSSADGYTGVWHLYVAETFDGGDHWTTTDATPSFPMQRMGLLRGGGGPMDRNLLDFFDLQIDKDGRVLVGYVNGCSGADCSQAPVNPDGSTSVTGNTYSATATIARQSSGRRMFASKDPAVTSVPGMPSVTERRVGPVVHLAWSEADPGNNSALVPDQTISSYQVFRGTTPGGENAVPIATLGGNVNKLDDTTATDPSVTYYYKVVANNNVGPSCANNEIAAPFVGDTCAGMIIHRNLPSHPEATGGGAGGVPVGPTPSPTPTPPPLTPQLLIDYVAVAEPPAATGQLQFQMKVGNLNPPPPDSRWRMVWNSVASPVEQFYVGMTTDQNSTVTFEYGTLETVTVPPVVGVLGVPTEHPQGAAPGSTYNADGTITILIAKTKVGNPQPGDFLGAVNGRTFATGDTPPETLERSSFLVDHTFVKSNTDNSYPAATYTVVGNLACPAVALVPVSAVSRKTHLGAGDFDVDLPLLGNPGIECRTGGPSKNFKVVFTFPVPITSGGSASVTPGNGGTATVVGSPSVNNTQVTVDLTNVSDNQVLTVNLVGVAGGGKTGNVSVQMEVLLGDVNATGLVDGNDVSTVQGKTRQSADLTNFRSDVNLTGLIDGNDVSITQGQTRAPAAISKPAERKTKMIRATKGAAGSRQN